MNYLKIHRQPCSCPLCGEQNRRESQESSLLTIKFANAEDKANFCRFIAACHEQDGTVTGFRAGIACAALKRSSIVLPAELKYCGPAGWLPKADLTNLREGV